MIRPLTIVTFLMASGSGLYLYQSKHDAQVLDKTIERTVRETSALRDQSRLLVAEWTMLNDPGRLRQFSDTYLSLKSIAPSQYTSLADLDTRLPARRADPPHVDEAPPAVPVAADSAAAPIEDEPDADMIAEEVLPLPPIPAPPHAVAVAVPRQVERPAAVERPVERVAERPAPVPRPPEVTPPQRMVATAPPRPVEPRAQRPAETRVSDARPIELHPAAPQAPRPAPAPAVALAPRPAPAPAVAMAPRPAPPAPAPAAVAAVAPYGGSLLGMARGSMPPSPRPMPVSSTQWSNTN